ncbi:hypothetical protein BZA77DRAFT_302976 [Pyronema omphalodes]|nr:hypothetical protein BZA77DRAFT_302976 [Pyronema omphalodes]
MYPIASCLIRCLLGCAALCMVAYTTWALRGPRAPVHIRAPQGSPRLLRAPRGRGDMTRKIGSPHLFYGTDDALDTH